MRRIKLFKLDNSEFDEEALFSLVEDDDITSFEEAFRKGWDEK